MSVSLETKTNQNTENTLIKSFLQNRVYTQSIKKTITYLSNKCIFLKNMSICKLSYV